MSTLTPLIEAWDEAHREFNIALEGLADEDVWKRAHPRLLSVGELAGHIAYWQAVGAQNAGNTSRDLTGLAIESPLLNEAFRYYTSNADQPTQLDIGTAQVLAEVQRIRDRAKAVVGDKAKEDPYPGNWGTWGNFVQYQAFHVAYHTGQIYSVRHMLGHETEDN